MDTLLNLMEKMGIQFNLSDELPEAVNGFFYHDDSHDIIVMNSEIEDETEFRMILSHELGHFFTAQICTISSISTQRIQVDRNEIRAIRWACDYLIDTEALLSCLDASSNHNMLTLAEQFQVTLETLQLKLYFMSLDAPLWKLSSNCYFVLSSYPTVYITAPSEDSLFCLESKDNYLSFAEALLSPVRFK